MALKYLSLLDTDLTFADRTENPADTLVVNEPGIDIVSNFANAERDDPGSRVIVTGREHSNDGDRITTHTIDKILAPILAVTKLTIISNHGMVVHLPDGDRHVHPLGQKVTPHVLNAQDAMREYIDKHGDMDLLLEFKAFGMGVNMNRVRPENLARTEKSIEQLLAPFAADTGLALKKEPGAWDLRAAEQDKAKAVMDALENRVIPGKEARKAFYCDSLKPHHGTDWGLAEALKKNKDDCVVQVLNGQPVYDGANFTFDTPRDLRKALCDGFSPFGK